MHANNFEHSLTLEAFSLQQWIAPARLRDAARWQDATDAEQAKGIDFHLDCAGKPYSLELKTDGLPENFFMELFQVVESRKSFELGYAFKCEADFLVLGNLPGMFAAVVPRAAFLTHAMNIALMLRNSRTLSLVVNAKSNVVSRAAIGLPVPYAAALNSFKQPWALVDLRSPDCAEKSEAFLARTLLKGRPSEASPDDWEKARGIARARMFHGDLTIKVLQGLESLKVRTDKIEDAVSKLAALCLSTEAAAVNHRMAEALAWVGKGVVTGQVDFVDRFQEPYCSAGGEFVRLSVRPVGPSKRKSRG